MLLYKDTNDKFPRFRKQESRLPEAASGLQQHAHGPDVLTLMSPTLCITLANRPVLCALVARLALEVGLSPTLSQTRDQSLALEAFSTPQTTQAWQASLPFLSHTVQ